MRNNKRNLRKYTGVICNLWLMYYCTLFFFVFFGSHFASNLIDCHPIIPPTRHQLPTEKRDTNLHLQESAIHPLSHTWACLLLFWLTGETHHTPPTHKTQPTLLPWLAWLDHRDMNLCTVGVILDHFTVEFSFQVMQKVLIHFLQQQLTGLF